MVMLIPPNVNLLFYVISVMWQPSHKIFYRKLRTFKEIYNKLNEVGIRILFN